MGDNKALLIALALLVVIMMDFRIILSSLKDKDHLVFSLSHHILLVLT